VRCPTLWLCGVSMFAYVGRSARIGPASLAARLSISRSNRLSSSLFVSSSPSHHPLKTRACPWIGAALAGVRAECASPLAHCVPLRIFFSPVSGLMFLFSCASLVCAAPSLHNSTSALLPLEGAAALSKCPVCRDLRVFGLYSTILSPGRSCTSSLCIVF